MRLELSHASIGRLLDGQEVTVDGVVVSAHDSRDAAYATNESNPVAAVTPRTPRKRPEARDGKPFMMAAKFAGTCAANCGEPIHPGERIQWAPEAKEARHARCVS